MKCFSEADFLLSTLKAARDALRAEAAELEREAAVLGAALGSAAGCAAWRERHPEWERQYRKENPDMATRWYIEHRKNNPEWIAINKERAKAWRKKKADAAAAGKR